MPGVPRYLVETYLDRTQLTERTARDAHARMAADALIQAGLAVSFDHSLYLSEDEICFYVFDALSATDAAFAARSAGLDPIRVVEAIETRAVKTNRRRSTR